MTQSLNRKAAAEFSFFLAIPMMFGASAIKLLKFLKEGNTFTGEEINLLIIGNVIGFIVAITPSNPSLESLPSMALKLLVGTESLLG